MVVMLAHRGPDGRGVAGDERAAVGMCRLRLRGRPDEAIPFADPERGERHAYCGEVYRLHVDGEPTVPEGGPGEARAAARYAGAADGMFALATLDGGGTIRLTRDGHGIKPLYLRQTTDGVAAASELPALLAATGVPAVRQEAVGQLLYAGCLVDGGTCFTGVRPVRPGERLTVRDGRVVASTGQPAGTGSAGRRQPSAGELRAAITASVRAGLISDRPVGLAVSGGLDSTIIAAELARAGVRGLRTVSVVPSDAGDGVTTLAELGLPAGATATWRHRWVRFRPEELLDGLPGVVAALGEPTMLTSSAMYAALAETAAAHGIVVLMLGEGADELFGGYRSYLRLLPPDGTSPVAFYAPPRHTALVASLLHDDVVTHARDRLAGAVRRAERTLAERDGRPPAPRATVRLLERTLSLEPLLRRADHLLMAVGIEGRTPLLHGDVPRLADALRPADLFGAGRTKPALADAYAGVLDDRIRLATKRPFRAPLATWFAGPLAGRVRAGLLAACEALESVGVRPDGVRRLADAPVCDESAAVRFRLLAIAQWVRWLAAGRPAIPPRGGAW